MNYISALGLPRIQEVEFFFDLLNPSQAQRRIIIHSIILISFNFVIRYEVTAIFIYFRNNAVPQNQPPTASTWNMNKNGTPRMSNSKSVFGIPRKKFWYFLYFWTPIISFTFFKIKITFSCWKASSSQRLLHLLVTTILYLVISHQYQYLFNVIKN